MSVFMCARALPEPQLSSCIHLIFLWVRVGRCYQFMVGRLGCGMYFVLLLENGSDAVLSMAGLQNKTHAGL